MSCRGSSVVWLRRDKLSVPGRVSLSRMRNVPGSLFVRFSSASRRFIIPKYHLSWSVSQLAWLIGMFSFFIITLLQHIVTRCNIFWVNMDLPHKINTVFKFYGIRYINYKIRSIILHPYHVSSVISNLRFGLKRVDGSYVVGGDVSFFPSPGIPCFPPVWVTLVQHQQYVILK